MQWLILPLALLIAVSAFAQSPQQEQNDRALRGIVQSLSQAQQMLLGLPEVIAENKRLQAENKELHKKQDEAVKPPPPP